MNQLISAAGRRRPDAIGVDSAASGDLRDSDTERVANDESHPILRRDAPALRTRWLARRPATIKGLLAQHVTCLCVVAPVAVLLGMPLVIVVSYAGGVLGTTAWLLMCNAPRNSL